MRTRKSRRWFSSIRAKTQATKLQCGYWRGPVISRGPFLVCDRWSQSTPNDPRILLDACQNGCYFDLLILCFLFSNFQRSSRLWGSLFYHLFICNGSNYWTDFQRHDHRKEIYRWEETEDGETNWRRSYFVLWSSPWGSSTYIYTCLTVLKFLFLSFLFFFAAKN